MLECFVPRIPALMADANHVMLERVLWTNLLQSNKTRDYTMVDAVPNLLDLLVSLLYLLLVA